MKDAAWRSVGFGAGQFLPLDRRLCAERGGWAVITGTASISS